MKNESNIVVRLLKGFAMFWWDFLVGDTPELFVATLVTIGVVFAISNGGHHRIAAVITLPVLALLSLTVSVRRAVRNARKK